MKRLVLISILVLCSALLPWAQDRSSESSDYVKFLYLTDAPTELVEFIRENIAPHIERDENNVPTKDIFLRGTDERCQSIFIASTAPSNRRVVKSSSGDRIISYFTIIDDIVVFVDWRVMKGQFFSWVNKAKLYNTFDYCSGDSDFNSEVWRVKYHNDKRIGSKKLYQQVDYQKLDYNFELTNLINYEMCYRPFEDHVYDSVPQTLNVPVVDIRDAQLSDIMVNLIDSLTADKTVNPEEFDIYVRMNDLYSMGYDIYTENYITIDFENTNHIPFGDVAGVTTINGFRCYFDKPSVNFFTKPSNESESIIVKSANREESSPRSYVFKVKITNFDHPRNQMELKLFESEVLQSSKEQETASFYSNPDNEMIFIEFR